MSSCLALSTATLGAAKADRLTNNEAPLALKGGGRIIMTSAHSAPRASARTPFVVWARKLHLYLGVLFAPAILFFAATGIVQVLDLHQSSAGYDAPELLQRLGALHKNQLFSVPHKSDGGQKAKAKATGRPVANADEHGGHSGHGGHHAKADAAAPIAASTPPSEAATAPPPTPAGPKPAKTIGLAQGILKGFAILAAGGLIVATLLGLYMAYRFNRNRWLIAALFLAGIVVPVILVAVQPG
jgi:hypothetical protein